MRGEAKTGASGLRNQHDAAGFGIFHWRSGRDPGGVEDFSIIGAADPTVLTGNLGGVLRFLGLWRRGLWRRRWRRCGSGSWLRFGGRVWIHRGVAGLASAIHRSVSGRCVQRVHGELLLLRDGHGWRPKSRPATRRIIPVHGGTPKEAEYDDRHGGEDTRFLVHDGI